MPGVRVELIAGPTTGPEGSLETPHNVLPASCRQGGEASLPASLPDLLIPELVRPIHPWFDLLAWRKLARHFGETRPDIVHTHSGKAGVLGRLAARRARVPVVVHTIHGPSFGSFQGPLANAVFRSAERVAGKSTTHFIGVAQAMIAQYLAAGIGAPFQYTLIRSGFSLEPFLKAANDPARRAALGLAPSDFVLGMIARFFKLKGHDSLFACAPELVRRCPRIKFLLVGDGPWRGRFEEAARALGLADRFVFPGLVPPAQIPALIGIMDALVHLSLREGLARALPQALAAGKPVVAYDCDGAREVCVDGETGILLPPGADITDAVVRLAGDEALRASLGQRGCALVSREFPVGKMVREIHALYERLLTPP